MLQHAQHQGLQSEIAAHSALLRVVCCVCRRNAAWLQTRSSQLFVLNMELAALAMVVDHEHAQTMNSLVLQIEQLTRESQQLAVQALQYRRETLCLRAVVTAALQGLRRNDLESAEGQLLQGLMY